MLDKQSINPEFIETLKTIDLVFYSHDLLLEGLIQKYGGRRIDDLSASINYFYEQKYVDTFWPEKNIGIHPIIIKCHYDTFGLIRNQSENIPLIEKLIEHEISHEIREGTIFINRPCYATTGQMEFANPNNIFSELPWNITGIDLFDYDFFLYNLNLFSYISIQVKLEDLSMKKLQETIKKYLPKN
jgi:hypothetical protein